MSACPERSVWERFSLGQLEDADSQPLITHLATCSLCCETADYLRTDDPLIAALRFGCHRIPREDEPGSQKLMERLQLLSTLLIVEEEDAIAPTPGIAIIQEYQSLLSPPQSPDELGRLGERYRLLKVLGQGGMSVVFLADDLQLPRRVSLKIVKPSLANSLKANERFLFESRALARLDHPNIVTIFEASQVAGVPYLTMPYLHGETLRQCLQRKGSLPLPGALRIAREIDTGLAKAHRLGLLHRDIKPENIFLELPVRIAHEISVAAGSQAAERQQLGAGGDSLRTEHIRRSSSKGATARCRLSEAEGYSGHRPVARATGTGLPLLRSFFSRFSNVTVNAGSSVSQALRPDTPIANGAESQTGQDDHHACRVKILDFGIARAFGLARESEHRASFTLSGTVIGTPDYMAPEQSRADQVDRRADLFSLGCVLYEMLTGTSPFRRANVMQTLLAVQLDPPAALNDFRAAMPTSVSAFVITLLAKDPSKRPDSAEAVVATITALESQASHGPVKPGRHRASKGVRNRFR